MEIGKIIMLELLVTVVSIYYISSNVRAIRKYKEMIRFLQNERNTYALERAKQNLSVARTNICLLVVFMLASQVVILLYFINNSYG